MTPAKAKSPELKYTHEWVALDKIRPHPVVQREFRKAHAEAMAADFNPDAFGEPYLITDGNGGYFVWSGQHRCHAARMALGEKQQVMCRVYRELATKDLAAIVLDVDFAKPWQAIDRFRNRVTSEEWQARAITGTLTQHGLRISQSPEEGNVAAVSALDWIVEKCGGIGTLDRVIRVLKGAWGRDRDAYHNTMLRGVALLCGRYNGKLTDRALSERLQKTGGPARFIGRARDRAKTNAQTVPIACAEILVNEYNKGRGPDNRLPPFAQ